MTNIFLKKSLLIISAVAIFVLSPVNANALMQKENTTVNVQNRKQLAEDKSGSCGDSVNYTFTADTGELKIFGTGDMSDYSSDMRAPWESYRNQLKAVIILDGVTKIGKESFYDYTGRNSYQNIKSLIMPESITEIGSRAFDCCFGLNGTLKIPSRVISIGSFAFNSCINLNGTLTIPSGVTEIGTGAFSGCCNIMSVSIPNSIALIEQSTFSGCRNLTFVVVPSSVRSIGHNVFFNCAELVTLIYKGSSNPGASSSDVFYQCNKLKEVLVPAHYKNSTFCGLPIKKIFITKNYGPVFSKFRKRKYALMLFH